MQAQQKNAVIVMIDSLISQLNAVKQMVLADVASGDGGGHRVSKPNPEVGTYLSETEEDELAARLGLEFPTEARAKKDSILHEILGVLPDKE